jgi:hypothetical protein
MDFRIRNPDGNEADFERCEDAYRQHLKRFKKSSNTDLWQFFGWDFFHDGSMESIHIRGDLQTVVIRVNCPNIKRLKADGDYEYINVMFECTFHTVSTVTVQYETPEHECDVKKSDTIFLDAEINTSPIRDSFGPENELEPDPYYSLLYNTPQNLDQRLRWIRCLSTRRIQETNDGEQA